MDFTTLLIIGTILGCIPPALIAVIVIRMVSRSGTGAVHNGVIGTAEVVSVSMPSGGGAAIMSSCSMNVVLTGPGIRATASAFRGIVRVANWPSPGMKLPASIDPADPRRFTVLWTQVPDRRVAAEALAEQIAAQLREREGKVLGRALVLDVQTLDRVPLSKDSDAERLCLLRLQLYADGESSATGEGRRTIPADAFRILKPGRSLVAAWVDMKSPDEFVLDFTQTAPEVRMGRATGPNSLDAILANGSDGCVRIVARSRLDGVRSYRGDDFYIVQMVVTSAKPEYEVVNAQAVPAAELPSVRPGAVLPVKIGTGPEAVCLAFAGHP